MENRKYNNPANVPLEFQFEDAIMDMSKTQKVIFFGGTLVLLGLEGVICSYEVLKEKTSKLYNKYLKRK